MRPAIRDLAQLSDEHLFQEISEGISHIVENARSLEKTGRRLHEIKECRAAKIFRGLAEEESAKVFILLDAVRCPRDRLKNAETLKCFYNHVAKRIYSGVCWWDIHDFSDLSHHIEIERRAWYLDGPNDVDWIFPNSARWEREQEIYVDYVQDITEKDGPHFWNCPPPADVYFLSTQTPASIEISQAMCQIGATTPKGLTIIAEVWRAFEPKPETSREDLRRRNICTLERLAAEGLCSTNDPGVQIVAQQWPFPLWTLEITAKTRDPDLLNRLRDERNHYILWLQETEAKRDPAPAISRDKVEALNSAYTKWCEEKKKRKGSYSGNETKKIRLVPADTGHELASYVKLEKIFKTLTNSERVSLFALANFSRNSIANWPHEYEHSCKIINRLGYGYQIGLARYWLDGFKRWEEEPGSFRAGQWRNL